MTCFITFLISMVSCFIYKKLAPRLNLIDCPKKETRKQHDGTPAQVGGLGIFTALFALLILGVTIPKALIVGMSMFLVLGIYDDAFHIPAFQKLILQIIMTTIIISALGYNLKNLGYLLDKTDIFQLADWSFAITLIATIAFINAFNLIDGLDGFAGGMTAITLSLCALISCTAGLTSLTTTLLVIISALIGFLIFNMRSPLRKKASIFLGDGGSLCIAFMLCWTAIELANNFPRHNDIMPQPLALAFFLAYPIYDMLSVMTLRKLKGKSIFAPDNLHLHFMLKSKTRTDGRVCVMLLCLHAVYCAAGLLSWKYGFSSLTTIALWGALAGAHFSIYKAFAKNRH